MIPAVKYCMIRLLQYFTAEVITGQNYIQGIKQQAQKRIAGMKLRFYRKTPIKYHWILEKNSKY